MTLERSETNQRMSQIVVHGDTVYLAGQVAKDFSGDIKAQTQSVLDKVDALLANAGTSKKNLLSALIHITDMRHFEQMNEVWDAWVEPGHTPARTCVEANLARPEILVEVTIVAAK